MSQPILLEIDGEGVEPETIDPLVALELAGRYFDLLRRAAASRDVELDLVGLEVVNKCVGIQVNTPRSDAEVRQAAMDAGAAIDGVRPIKGTGDLVKRLRKALGRVDSAKVLHGDWVQEIRHDVGAQNRPFEVVSLRARVLRVGGKDPMARFSSGSELKSFTLAAGGEDRAKELAEHLYEDVELVARVQRDSDGDIQQGFVESFTTLQQDNSYDLWRSWFADSASEWNDVPDVEKELGRDEGG